MKPSSNIAIAFELLLGSITETEISIRQEAATGILRPGGSLEQVKLLAGEVLRLEKLKAGVSGVLKAFTSSRAPVVPLRRKVASPVSTTFLERLYLEYLADGKPRENWEVARNISFQIAQIATERDMELIGTVPRWQSKLRGAKARLLAKGKIEHADRKSVRLAGVAQQ